MASGGPESHEVLAGSVLFTMDPVSFIGFLAGTLTTIAFLPQAVRVWRTRHTHDLSLPTFLLFVFGILAWLAYGLLKGDWAIILANSATIILASIILVFKLRYK